MTLPHEQPGGCGGCVVALAVLVIVSGGAWLIFGTGYWALILVVAAVGVLAKEAERVNRRR